MTTIKVMQSMLIDPIALAEVIEAKYGNVLMPVGLGIYLPGHRLPAMIAGVPYYKMEAGRQVQVFTVEDITSDIFDENGTVVIPARQARQVSLGPSLPFRGIDLIKAVIEALLNVQAAWTPAGGYAMTDAIIGRLHPEFQDNTTQEMQLQLAEDILDTLIDLRSDITQFVGEDHWIMHFVREWAGSSFIVEKTIDYRIYDWERRMHEGEWKENG